MRAGTIAVVSGLSLLGAIAYSQPARELACKVKWSEGASFCDWEVVEFEQPVLVRTVEGTLANEGSGRWPDGVDVVIELADSRNHSVRHLAHARRPSGRFKIRNVPPGEYCFRIGVRPGGWCCVQGRIIVSRTAPPTARVDVTVPLAK